MNEDGQIHNSAVNRIRYGGLPAHPSIHLSVQSTVRRFGGWPAVYYGPSLRVKSSRIAVVAPRRAACVRFRFDGVR